MIHTLQRHDFQGAGMMEALREYLEELYTPSDGWKIFNRFRWSTAIPEMIIQKESRKGFERVIVAVELSNTINGNSFSEINKLTLRLQHDTIGQPKRILVVDTKEATEGLPEDIEVLNLNDLLQHKIRATEPKLVA